MEVTRQNRPIFGLLALAIATRRRLPPRRHPVRLGSGRLCRERNRTLQTNPMRRVYTEDMEMVYRIGVDIGQRDQMERNLGSELGSYPEVWCAWFDPGTITP